MFFDCRRMGPERRFDLVVSDVDRAASFYRSVMGARELFRHTPGHSVPTRLGLAIGDVEFAISPAGSGEAGTSDVLLTKVAKELGADFDGIMLYVENPAMAATRALAAGSQRHAASEAARSVHVDRRVEVVVDPFENIWAFAAP